MTMRARENLTKIADYLESMPADYAHFDMGHWTNLFDDQDVQYGKENGGLAQFGCNTVACVVGHGPAAGILVKDEYITNKNTFTGNNIVNWDEYAKANFWDLAFRIRWHDLSSWLFSSSWDEIDNHHWGAAARIRYFLEHGIPEDFGHPCSEDVEIYSAFRKEYA